MMFIRVSGLNKTFGKGEAAAHALREVNLEIGKGELVSITGPSGCGKTTLLHIMAGIESIDHGEVWIGDMPLHSAKEKEISQFRLEHMGFVFQSYHLIPVLSAWENAAMPLLARAIAGKPELIWADEPTGALDSETAKQIVGLLEMLNRHHGTTIVMVTHDQGVAERAQRIIRLQNGRIIHDGGRSL
jgi:putative ABC transport system ATP-binding protein